PLSILAQHSARIGATDSLDARLNLSRTDEIGILAHAFDQMMSRLEDTRKRLLDQSYFSGVAEMASGVLHNIGNAITPLTVKLSKVSAELTQAPHHDLATAVRELTQQNPSLERREDLSNFIELASAELADDLDAMTVDVATAIAQAQHVHLILVEQQRFARAECVSESFDVSELVAQSIALLPADGNQSIRIICDASLEQIPRVNASRIALQQVIGNLLINAAESIAAHFGEVPGGVIRIAATAHTRGHSAVLAISIADNGGGIGSDMLGHLYERGFSTKQRGSGMGLHWCANTVAALGGALRAESPGIGLGATFILDLPMATSSIETHEEAA
ncbi:MAG: ATP-binding protein, partial [Gammaproteobacteria bacterium]